MSADKDFRYRIAYDEAVRALSQQQATIEGLRSRAGLLLSSAAITTSFLWPHRLEYTANPENVIESYIETEEPLRTTEIHRDLSLHMHDSYADNLVGQKQVAARFRIAGVLLTLEVVLWLIDLAART